MLQNSMSKRGSGVALFGTSNLKCTILGNITVIDNLMEGGTIEIKVERSERVLISRVYRTPECCIDQFITMMCKNLMIV